MFPSAQELNKHIITIQHSLDGFSYATYNIDNQQFTDLKLVSEPDISLKEAIAEIEIENNCDIKNFKKIIVVFNNNRNTFVPAAVFQNENKDKYLDILGLTNENSVSCTDFIKNADANNVFAISKEEHEILENLSENIEYHHAASVLVASLVDDNIERVNDTRIYLNIKSQKFEMTVIKGCNLLFDNTFCFKTKEDFLYFLLFSIDQLHLDAGATPVYFLGMIEEKSKLVELTSRYVRDIRFVRRDNEINLAPELEETPFYYHYVLYKSLKCEL